MKCFALRGHTADVAVEAHGDTLGEAFAAVADGLTAAMCDDVPDGDHDHERVPVSVSAESREALLFDFLDELIYLRDVHGVLPADHEAHLRRVDDGGEAGDVGGGEDGGEDGQWVLEGSFRGIPFSEVVARDVKAVTYSEMNIERTEDGWGVYVVFDV